VPNLMKIDSAIAALRMREKTRCRVGFFCLHIYLSINPFFNVPTGYIFSAILMLNGSYDMFLQPLMPFRVKMREPPFRGSNPPKTPILET